MQRSKSYAEIQDVAGAEPHVHALLYCYPSDRSKWERLLQTWVTLVNSSKSPADMEAYALDCPHAVLLVQFALAVPLGAHKSLPSWMREGILLRKNQNSNPLFDLPATPEIRRFANRPDDHETCRVLFDAARKANLFVPVRASTESPNRFALATVDPQFDSLFALDSFEPDWKTEEFLHQKIKNTEFVRGLEIAFPKIHDLGATLRTLARENDAHRIANELVVLNIVEPGATGHHFRIRSSSPENLPLELFRRKNGELQGLTAGQCIDELHRNDDLFSTVFFQVCDAYTGGRLSPNDVPPFVLDSVKTL